MSNCNCIGTGHVGRRWPFELEFDFPESIMVTIDNIETHRSTVCCQCCSYGSQDICTNCGEDNWGNDISLCSDNADPDWKPPCNAIFSAPIGGVFLRYDCFGPANGPVTCTGRSDIYRGTYILSNTHDSATNPTYSGQFNLGSLFTYSKCSLCTGGTYLNCTDYTARTGLQPTVYSVYAYITFTVNINFPSSRPSCNISFYDPHLKCYYERFGYQTFRIQAYGGCSTGCEPINGLHTTQTIGLSMPRWKKIDLRQDNEFVSLEKGNYTHIPSVIITGIY